MKGKTFPKSGLRLKRKLSMRSPVTRWHSRMYAASSALRVVGGALSTSSTPEEFLATYTTNNSNSAPRVAHTWYRMQVCVVHRGIKSVGGEPSWCTLNPELSPCSLLYSQLREQVSNVRMVVSPLWRGLGNIHGFIQDGKSYRQG